MTLEELTARSGTYKFSEKNFFSSHGTIHEYLHVHIFTNANEINVFYIYEDLIRYTDSTYVL